LGALEEKGGTNMNEIKVIECQKLDQEEVSLCKDFDEDCSVIFITNEGIWNCWLYAPERGACPLLA